MLNCCIERKIARANLSYVSAENSEDSDDEFFDATDQEEFEERRKGKYCPWDRPVGRLSPFANLKLIKTGDLLYIPFTQDPVLKTEDQLEEDTDILLKLGTNNEASQLRARIMSASLLSDMQSFKAANPGAVLEDFIRWYSPRDWIQAEELDEYGQKQGALSQRMQLEGNIWMEMWQNSKPVPAHRQKRLFDDTKEAEKVLQFLELRTVGQIAELILPVLSHATISRLIVEAESLTEEFAKDLLPRTSSLARQCEKISRDIQFQPNKFEAFIQETIDLEMSISQFNSLQYKLNPHRLDDYLVNKCIVRNYAFKTDLKIKWVRPEKIPCYKPQKSGDLAGIPEQDKGQYLLEFRNSKELESANEHVKRLFTLEFNPSKCTKKAYRQASTDLVRSHDFDHSSIEVRLARWTGYIRAWQEVVERFPRNQRLKVCLKELIDKRKKHLKYLRRWDYKKFEWLIEQLNIVYKPPPSEFHWITRKESLVKLTDKFCENIKQERLNTLRLKFESEQPAFLDEKIRSLEFIRNEQKDCGVDVTVQDEEIDKVKKQLEELKSKTVVTEEY
ncbi:hypothetical protein HUJ04_002642 [Dendroctonus ponderosae]|nr:hypothetical protein HUJ04_002642 [Dendroctonus ponderosae]